MRDASPFRGNGGLPYYGLLSIPLPAFPPYVVATTHIRGTRTIALKRVSMPFSHLAQQCTVQAHASRSNRLVTFGETEDFSSYGLCFGKPRGTEFNHKAASKKGSKTVCLRHALAMVHMKRHHVLILQNGGHNCQEGATLTR